jgi:hypothetical protein
LPSDDFTRRKFDWLDQVVDDERVSPQAFRLAYRLATKYLNRGTGDCYPSQETLCRLIGVSTTNGLRHLIDQLVDRGHLEVTVARGRGHTNRYRPLLKQASADRAPPPDAAAPTQATLFPEAEHADGRKAQQQPGPHLGQFEEWWPLYPKHAAKAAALRAFGKALKSATLDELKLGAMRYAAERSGQDPKYTKHPATWLNGSCWLDEPAAARPAQAVTIDETGATVAPTQENRGRAGGSWSALAMKGSGS